MLLRMGLLSGFALAMLVVLLPGASAQVPPQVGADTGPVDLSVPIEETSTPPVPSLTVNTPAVSTVPTCSLSPCSTPTHLDGLTVTTPGIETPDPFVPGMTVVPGGTCLVQNPTSGFCYVVQQDPIDTDPIGPFLVPDLQEQTFATGPVDIPALCQTLVGLYCLPAMTLIGSSSVSTPPVPYTLPLVPAGSVGVQTAGVSASMTHHVGEFTAVPEMNVQGTVICPGGCNPENMPGGVGVPVAPEASAVGSVSLHVALGSFVNQTLVVSPP